ncbi:hypothetical protein ACHAQJ_010638 [Trichoderma viride]
MKTFSSAVVPMLLLLGASALKPPVHVPPPVHGPPVSLPPPIDNGCCCCDISIRKISCDRSIPASDCFCAEVICPAGAPTVWIGVPPAPRPTAAYTPAVV